MVRRSRFSGGGVSFDAFWSAVGGTVIVWVLCGASTAVVGQPKEQPRMTSRERILTIQGQVSLPEGGPAGRAVVILTSSDGVPRQAYTTEHGRFEFQGLPEGSYSLIARSLIDETLKTERIETDTSRTATGSLNVNLILHKETNSGAIRKAGVVNVAEAEQKIPKESRSAFRQAIKFREINEPERALQSLDRAIELYPEYYQALAERGDIYVIQRKLPEAAADFERALKINARFGPALRGAGYCKLEKREFGHAIKYLEQSIVVQPEYANTYLLLGIAYLETDQRPESKAALLKALSFNTPRELRAHIYLGNLFAREHMFGEAAGELRKYLEARPDDPDAETLRAVESQWRARAKAP